FAMTLAATAALLTPAFLGTDHYYSMNCLDLLAWTTAALLVIEATGTDAPRPWALLGIALGLGLLNKISVLWLGGALLVGLLLTGHRRRLRGPGPWLAAGIAGLLFAPHVAWQALHGWPTLEFMRNATAHKMAAIDLGRFALDQILSMGP